MLGAWASSVFEEFSNGVPSLALRKLNCPLLNDRGTHFSVRNFGHWAELGPGSRLGNNQLSTTCETNISIVTFSSLYLSWHGAEQNVTSSLLYLL